MRYLDPCICSCWYLYFHLYIFTKSAFLYTDMICMHCVHLFQQPTGSLQGRCSFQLVPNQVYKDDYNKQTVCFNTLCIVNIPLFLESSPYVGRIYVFIYILYFYVYTHRFSIHHWNSQLHFWWFQYRFQKTILPLARTQRQGHDQPLDWISVWNKRFGGWVAS